MENEIRKNYLNVCLERNDEVYALFDSEEAIRGFSYCEKDLKKLRKELGWGRSCKIKEIKINWKIK